MMESSSRLFLPFSCERVSERVSPESACKDAQAPARRVRSRAR